MSSFPPRLRDLLTELDFYNLTKDNEKICFATRKTVSSTSPYGSVYRWWHGESSSKLISETKNSIENCSEALNKLEWYKYRPDVFIRVIELDSTIQKQIKVYGDRNDVVAELKVARDQITHILSSMTPDEKEAVNILRNRSNLGVGSVSPSNGYKVPSPPEVTIVNESPGGSPGTTPSTSPGTTPSASPASEDLMDKLINQSGTFGPSQDRNRSSPIPIKR